MFNIGVMAKKILPSVAFSPAVALYSPMEFNLLMPFYPE
jgi:hypothetical protein